MRTKINSEGKKLNNMAAEGKYVIFNEGGFFYKYRLVASNGQKMIISEPYRDEKGCREGINTLKKNINTIKIDFEKDKKHRWCFRIISAQGRPLAQSANYDSWDAAAKASESFQRWIDSTKVVVDDSDESSHYDVTILKEEIAQNDKGKFEILTDDESFYYQLKANNGQVLCVSQAYKTYDSCKKAMENFRKGVYEGDFYIFIDKKKQAFFKLYSKQLRLIMTGETYKSKDAAESAAKSVLKFAKNAKLVE